MTDQRITHDTAQGTAPSGEPIPLARSRVVATAARLGADAPDHQRLFQKRVLLTGEAPVLAGPNGRVMLLTSLRLLMRVTSNLTVAIPPELGTLARECEAEAQRVCDPLGAVHFVPTADAAHFDAALSIGTLGRADAPTSVINTNGWTVRLASTGRNLPPPGASVNPVAAVAAAGLGVTEVFTRLCRVTYRRGPLLEDLCWSLFSYGVSDEPGPDLPPVIMVDLLLVGAGAIGNGIVAILRELPLQGRIRIIDGQVFGPENQGTCMLLGPGWLGRPKAEALAEWLTRPPALMVEGTQMSIETLARTIEQAGLPIPTIVLNALDNVGARRTAQGLWPDLALDGAIGDFMVQVGRHPWNADVACLQCLYREPTGLAAEIVASRATGLSVARIAEGTDVVRDSDVDAAPPGQQAFLRARVGQPICSVVSEAVLATITEAPVAGFEPSAPFVACLSAVLVVAEFVKHCMDVPPALAPRLQFDALRGPARAVEVSIARRADCTCRTRAPLIERLRAARGRSSAAPGQRGEL